MQPPDRPRDQLRASDADREHIANVLRDSYSEGRLTIDEFQERLERAYAARTHGDLAVLTSDLPVRSAPPPPSPAVPVAPISSELYWSRVRQIVLRYVVWCLFLITIWAATGRQGSFWPIWPIIVFAFFAASRVLSVERELRRRMAKDARRRQREEERLRRRGG
jgi:hypothetical protein